MISTANYEEKKRGWKYNTYDYQNLTINNTSYINSQIENNKIIVEDKVLTKDEIKLHNFLCLLRKIVKVVFICLLGIAVFFTSGFVREIILATYFLYFLSKIYKITKKWLMSRSENVIWIKGLQIICVCSTNAIICRFLCVYGPKILNKN